MAFSEQDFLNLCKAKIEEKYYAGLDGGKLRQRDFEYIIDLIEETSGISLSVSTLKRLWRKESGQNPHPSTLNALVSILGYKDWLEFKIQNQNAPELETDGEEPPALEIDGEEPPELEIIGEGPPELKIDKEKAPGAYTIRSKTPSVIIVAALVVISFFVLAVVELEVFKTSGPPEEEDVLFSANKTVTAGVPNTVIFNYDLKGIQADSFFIQQDWNPNNKEPVDPAGEYFSSIYYLPGFHKSKLIADETIISIERVHIQTDGWISAALYSFDEPPVYLELDTNHDGILRVNEQSITDNRVDIERFWSLLLLNIREFGDLDGHNFRFATRFKHSGHSNNPCPSMQFTIHTEEHIYFVPLTPKGCVSNIGVKIGEVYASGRDNDLSGFGTDISEWQEVVLYVEDKAGKVYLNGEQIFEAIFEQEFGKIMGVDYRFSGLGEVDYLKLSDLEDTVVYAEEFEL